jgi:hypothetical protein
MHFAQIKNGIIQNIIVLDDMSLESVFSQGFDYFIRIDNIDPVPHLGDLYDGVNFNKPEIQGDQQ